MKFEDLLVKLGEHGFFDLASVVQLTEERRESVQVQLYRWCKKGKLIPLRRGMYAVAEPYISRPINPAHLANHLYTPSYLSHHWALGYYGLIPEKVVTYTSISSRVPRTFENAFGIFSFRHMKPSVFFGYHSVQIDGQRVRMALPEKVLLDLWYLEAGTWPEARMAAMRFQNMELVNADRLQAFAARFASPRIDITMKTWLTLRDSEEGGTVSL